MCGAAVLFLRLTGGCVPTAFALASVQGGKFPIPAMTLPFSDMADEQKRISDHLFFSSESQFSTNAIETLPCISE